MALIPTDLPTGKVTGQFYFVSQDGIDADTSPELTVVSGVVTFTATRNGERVFILKIPSKTATLVPLVFQAKFDASGQLVPAAGTGIGVELLATDSSLYDPTDFRWQVDFKLRDVNTGLPLNIPAISLAVPAGATVDLSTAVSS